METIDRNMVILVVDDNSIMRTIISDILDHAGYKKVIVESDGSRALDIVKSRKIDLIISDWQMTGMTGIELLKKVREDGKSGKTPFIMVTVEGTKESRKMACQYGVSGYISKPFHGDDLLKEVAKVMAKFYEECRRLPEYEESNWGEKAFRVIQEDSTGKDDTNSGLALHLSSQARLILSHLPPEQFHQVMMRILSLQKNPFPGDSRQLEGYPFRRNDTSEYGIVYDILKNTLRIILVRKRG